MYEDPFRSSRAMRFHAIHHAAKLVPRILPADRDPAESAMTLREIPQECKSIIERHYGARFKGLILFGSMARNDGDSASDIDLLVLLGEPFDYFRELRTLVDLLYPVQLESNQLISAKPAAWDDFERGELQLYRNAKREGVAV